MGLVLIVGMVLMTGCDLFDKDDEDDNNPTEPPITVGIGENPTEPPKVDGNSTSTPLPTTNPTTRPTSVITQKKEFYGNWVYIDSGKSQKIDSLFIEDIKRLGDNFIELTRNNQILLRDGSSDGVVRGRLYTDIEHIQKFDREREEKITSYVPIFKKPNGEHKYKVIIDDGFYKQTKIVSANGEFRFKGVNIGISKIAIIDIEQVLGNDDTEIEENATIVVSTPNDPLKTPTETPIFQGEIPIKNEVTDLGNFPIPDKKVNYNFKTTKVIDEQSEDDRYMYENRTYTGKLSFVNSGTETAVALNYEITTSDPYVEELTHDVVMGSVDANESIEIPFEITFRRMDKIAHRVKLDFLIRDVNGKEWLDHVYLDIYQTPVTVNIKTKTSNLKGYFVTPEHEVIKLDTKDIKVKIPSRPDSNYYFLVTSPKETGAETAYSVGVDTNTTDFENFHDTSAFEPNNLEEKATKLELGDSIKSFIHKGDIDFFTIDFKEGLSFEPPQLPFN